ncbi:glycosyltransferase [Pantoea dispersa]
MPDTTDVSIIIPAWNAADTIGALLQQLLTEHNVSMEIIVVDDGSTDDTRHIVASIEDPRLRLVTQSNLGVYAARNAALAIHRGEWLMFLDADDEVSDGFVYNRWQKVLAVQADVMVCNGWRIESDGRSRAIHTRQPYRQLLSGHDWIRHCVTQREWPHYLWLQIARSSYIRLHQLQFHQGKSHKDILWTVELALSNARFYIADDKDYAYRINTASITNRADYYDVRALSYLDVIEEIIRLGEQPQHRALRRYLLRHALVESRHFLGLYRNNVRDRAAMRHSFRERISSGSLFRGISNFSDLCFYLKLWLSMRG